MGVELWTSDGNSIRFDPPGPGVCWQCGICCSRWQAPLDAQEAAAIAEGLGLSVDAFLREYAQAYPPNPCTYLIRHRDGVCVFLRREGKRALCSVHAVKPAACRAWEPALARKECQEGLSTLAEPGTLLRLSDLNLKAEDLSVLCRAAHGYSMMEASHEQEKTSSNAQAQATSKEARREEKAGRARDGSRGGEAKAGKERGRGAPSRG